MTATTERRPRPTDSWLVVAKTDEETAERAIRLMLAGVTDYEMRDVSTGEIRLPHDPDRIARGLLTVYQHLFDLEYEALLALNCKRQGRTKLALANAMAVCRRKGDAGVEEALRLIEGVFLDLRNSAPLRLFEDEPEPV